MKSTKKRVITFFSKVWKWSWILTLPMAVIFLIWSAGTINSFYTFKMKFKPYMPITLWNTGYMQAFYLLDDFKEMILPQKAPDGNGLEAIQLFVLESRLKKLNSNLPFSGREYVEGKLLYPNGKLYNVKVKYRGDFSYHWSGRKKSIRIKTRKSKLFKGMRAFNLIIPKSENMFSNYLSFRLAKKLDLPAPESDLVEVYINGKYIGVQVLTEQLGEQFLRRNNKMPGDLYVGETVGADKFPGVDNSVFTNPAFWTKSAINNHNPLDWMKPIERLVELTNLEQNADFSDLLDFESWGNFNAFITLSQTVHYDSTHNWRLFFDPAKGRLEPVIWDPFGWHVRVFFKWLSRLSNNMDIVTNSLFEKLHRDHRFMAEKHESIERFFLSGGDQYLLKILNDSDRLEESIKRDNNLHFDSVRIHSSEEVLEFIKKFKKTIAGSLGEIKKIYMDTPPVASYSTNNNSGYLQINTEGFTPLKWLEIEYDMPLKKYNDADIHFYKDGKKHSVNISPYLYNNKNVLRLKIQLFPRRDFVIPPKNVLVATRDVLIKPASYFLDIRGLDRTKVKRVRAGYAGGESVTLERKDQLETYSLEGNSGIVPVEDVRNEIIWSGVRQIDGVVEIDDNLTIKAGSTLRFSPGSSLFVRGKLHAAGTKDAPIRFVPAKEGQDPWGAVMLAGSGSDGSFISNCEFTGGSGVRHRLVEYSAMLSIHDVKDFTIDNCTLSDNKIVDDMLHAVYSEVTIRNTEFRNSLSDAVDLDYVSGRVENSVFIDSGNDALDLMSSQVVVIGSEMRGSGDKGISIGEGTDVFVWNTKITENEIGVQAKDRSEAVLYNVEFVGNKKTIDAYKKNWQYGDGGHASVYKSHIKGSSPAITADKNSSIRVYDSFLAGSTGKRGKKNKRILIDSTVDAESEFERKARSTESYRGDMELHEFLAPSLELIDPGVRGEVTL